MRALWSPKNAISGVTENNVDICHHFGHPSGSHATTCVFHATTCEKKTKFRQGLITRKCFTVEMTGNESLAFVHS